MNRILIIIFAFLPASVFALDPATVRPNQTYSTKGMINIHSAPPKTIFYILGDEKGLVDTNDTVTVKSVKEVNTIINKHYWFNVEKTDPNTQDIEQGWIYGGKAGSQSLLEVAQ